MDKDTAKQKLVQWLIEDMELKESADSRIEFCSGEEKKRLFIVVELIALPDILPLDEPTTGLDSSTSMKIVNLLGRYIETRNMIIVAVLHQCFITEPESHQRFQALPFGGSFEVQQAKLRSHNGHVR